jgi:serine protease
VAFKEKLSIFGRVLGLSLFILCSHARAEDLPWHLGALSPADQAPAAINTLGAQPGPNDVVVAVIDGGVISSHPSLQGRVLAGYDMLSAPNNLKGGRSADFSPDAHDAKCGNRLSSSVHHTHGTEIASLIAGNGHDGVVGVNPAAKILPVRLFGACQMTRQDLMDAMAWAAGLPVAGVPANPNPARVINLSFSGGNYACGKDLQQLLARIEKKNIFVVAAVGNTFGKKLSEPANCNGVISVGAVDAENTIENYSALDPRTVIYAPGGGKNLWRVSKWRNNKLKVATYDVTGSGDESAVGAYKGIGTSYAAPLVSGFISLLLSRQPTLKPADFLEHLDQYSRPVTPHANCAECKPRGLMLPAGS